MKFCFLVDSYKPIYDGVIRYFDGFIPALVEAGHEVTLVCPHLPGTQRVEHPHKGLTVLRCFNFGFQQEGYYVALPDKYLFRAVREADFVFIHSLATIGVIGGFLARIYRKKIGLFVHQDERIVLMEMLNRPRWITNFTVLLIAKIFYDFFVDVFFCATERFKGKLLDYQVSDSRIYFAPFAIDESEFHPDCETIDIRARHAIPQEAIVSLYVGRISKEKNIDNLLKGMDLAMAKAPNLYALFVGKKTDQSLIQKENLQHGDRMIFTGFVPEEELPSYYCASDFFTSPSLNESSCFTIFEAMSCALPVITSKYRHDKEIQDKYNAVLVGDLRNPRAIAHSILYLTKNKATREAIGKRGKKLIDSRSWSNHVQIFLKGVAAAFNRKKH